MDSFLNPAKKELIPYALLAQKQPGSLGSKFASVLKLPDNMKIFRQYPPDAKLEYNKMRFNNVLAVDKYWAALIEIKN